MAITEAQGCHDALVSNSTYLVLTGPHSTSLGPGAAPNLAGDFVTSWGAAVSLILGHQADCLTSIIS
jgi:hypothetical protein